MVFLTFLRRNTPYMSAQVHKPNNPNSVCWLLGIEIIKISMKLRTTLQHVLASLYSLSIWVSTSIKLTAPFEDFPPYYKSDFASLIKGASFRIAFIIKSEKFLFLKVEFQSDLQEKSLIRIEKKWIKNQPPEN